MRGEHGGFGMRSARLSLSIGAIVLALGGAASLSLAAQSSQNAHVAAPYTPPKTAWGDPDLQGIWPSTAMVGVPFERPTQYGNRLYLTDEEFRQRQKEAEQQ